MSKLEELIQKYCPDGVVYRPLSSICKSIRTGKLNANAMVDGGKYPFFTCSEKVFSIDTYSFDAEALLVAGNGYLGNVKYYKGKFDAYQRTYVLSDFVKEADIMYVFYSMQNSFREFALKSQKDGSVPYITIGIFDKYLIPIPPLPVQEEIVRVLDTFTALQTVLQAEQQKRQEQYQHYQDYLLNKSQFPRHSSIGELCDVKKGKTAIQKAKEGEYPLVVTTMERKSCDEYQFNANAVCIPLVSSRGHGIASLNHVYYQEGRFALGNILCAVIPFDEDVLKAKFLYYYLEYAKDYILVPLMKGGANVSMHCSDIEKVKIPVPSIQEQERIVFILDKFDTLTNDLISGLPAEIEKRRQQYEYYRDKLLTFKRKEA